MSSKTLKGIIGRKFQPNNTLCTAKGCVAIRTDNRKPIMKGTRPLNNTEIRLASACFDGTFEHRNRGLFMLGVSTGGRISELFSLQIGDVYQNQKSVTDLLFDRSIVKGGEVSSFSVPVNSDSNLHAAGTTSLISTKLTGLPQK